MSGTSPPSPLRATIRQDRRIHLAQAPGQDGCCVPLCGCLLVRAFLQSISQLIELISITKGFLLSQRSPTHGIEEGYATDLSCYKVLDNTDVLFMPD